MPVSILLFPRLVMHVFDAETDFPQPVPTTLATSTTRPILDLSRTPTLIPPRVSGASHRLATLSARALSNPPLSMALLTPEPPCFTSPLLSSRHIMRKSLAPRTVPQPVDMSSLAAPRHRLSPLVSVPPRSQFLGSTWTLDRSALAARHALEESSLLLTLASTSLVMLL